MTRSAAEIILHNHIKHREMFVKIRCFLHVTFRLVVGLSWSYTELVEPADWSRPDGLHDSTTCRTVESFVQILMWKC